jgi:hypothetical protein
MSQDQQFDVLAELAAATTREQPQQRREREIGEGKEHPAMLPQSRRQSASKGGT